MNVAAATGAPIVSGLTSSTRHGSTLQVVKEVSPADDVNDVVVERGATSGPMKNDSLGTATSAMARKSLQPALTSLTSEASPSAVALSSSSPDSSDAVQLDGDSRGGSEAGSRDNQQQQLRGLNHQTRKRRSSGESYEGTNSVKSNLGASRNASSAVTCVISGETNRDDDDDNDDDDDDDVKLQSSGIDPDRLKAFNLFVRLFVDENLDRIVPISKQPKDKIQAILEACDRQFAEFHDRSRKRIRTYLKSCRRMRRCKDGNGVEQLRPTPPHLTSAVAETILAQACENESNNAKRMRMGLEPLPALSVAGSSTSASPSSICPTGAQPLSQHHSNTRSSGTSPGSDQPSSRPPSRPPNSSSSGASVAAATTAASVISFPKQERISPGVVMLAARPFPEDEVALALTKTSSAASVGRFSQAAAHLHHNQHTNQPVHHGQAHQQQQPHQQQQLLMMSTAGSFDVQTAATMLFGYAPGQAVNGNAPATHAQHSVAHQRGPASVVGSSASNIGSFYGTPSSTVGPRSSTSVSSLQFQNGPTDLSLKKQPSQQSATSGLASLVAARGTGNASEGNNLPRNQLSAAEMETVKQLIAGYRESAAFLYRSADELEVLLQHN